MNLKEKASRAYRDSQLTLPKHEARFGAIAAKIAEVFGEDPEAVLAQGERLGYDTLRVGGLTFLGREITGKVVDAVGAYPGLDGQVTEQTTWTVDLTCGSLQVLLARRRRAYGLSTTEDLRTALESDPYETFLVEAASPAKVGQYLAMTGIYPRHVQHDAQLPEASLTDPTRGSWPD